MESSSTDITVYGATSFTAKHVLTYLMQSSLHLPHNKLKITLAGRNPSKLQLSQQNFTRKIGHLQTILAKEATGTCEFDTFTADSSDAQALVTMATRTKLVLNCAGPFAAHGSNVVAACAQTGTHYLDITGEVSWAGAMRLRYSQTASAHSHVRLISFCGFDAVPSDMAVFAARQALGGDDIQTATTWHYIWGTPNGGTIQTVMDIPLNLSRCFSRWVPFLLEDPLVLTHPTTRHDPDLEPTRNRLAAAEWRNQLLPAQTHTVFRMGASAPFFMAPTNAKVVHASAVALKYGRNFVYQERHVPAGFKFTTHLGPLSLFPALVTQMGVLLGLFLLKLPIIGRFLVNWLAPAGSGPPEEVCRLGFAQVYAQVTSSASDEDATSNNRANCFLKFSGDPGNMVTAQCVSEAALALLFNQDELPPRSKDGFGTPAELLGMPYLKRLQNSPIRPVTIETHVRKGVRGHEWSMFPPGVAQRSYA